MESAPRTSATAQRLHIPCDPDAEFAGLAWLVPANLLVVLTVFALTCWIVLTYPELPSRLLAAKAATLQVVSIAMLARGTRRTALQYTALVCGVLGAVAIGWALLDPATTGTLPNRLVVTMVVLGNAAAFYGLGIARLLPEASEWTLAARRLTPLLSVSAGLVTVAILGGEVAATMAGRPIGLAPAAIFAVAVTLLGLSVACLAAAVLPGRDPLGLSERGRQLYVYAAEILLCVMMVHIRLSMPWLFHGLFKRYWPVMIMVVAFIGTGLGETLRRQRRVVLGEPLENTGAFLPLLPVLGFWILPAQVNYSLLLLAVGVLYAGLSVARKSFGFGLLATLAANGGLWYFLQHQEGIGLLAHPQVWLIPPALCVLAAAYLNREQLSKAQMSTVRYLTSSVVYVSSTADIFLNGVSQAPMLPLILAALSIAGIFAGIFLRVRAFLFLSTSFLVLALFTIIWHAAVDLQQTWLWAASGIVAGVLIIALFALFEKKRQDMLLMLDELKQWKA